MRRDRKARLARLGARLNHAAAAELDERGRLGAIAVIAAAVRAGLASAGVDPAGAARLREAELAAAALAGLPDPPADAAPGPEGDPDALDAFVAETQRHAERYAAGDPIDLATAPLADLLAWCIAQGALALQRDGSENLLLICCRAPEQRDAADADLAREIMGLDQRNSSDSTKRARDLLLISCRFSEGD